MLEIELLKEITYGLTIFLGIMYLIVLIYIIHIYVWMKKHWKVEESPLFYENKKLRK